jgi:TP901 family phage tail tape measure protein
VSVVANVAINVDSRGAVSKLRQVQTQSQQTERAVEGLSRAFGGLAAAFGAGFALTKVIADVKELDTNLRRLGTVGGNVAALDKGLGALSDRLDSVANKAELAAASYQALSAGFTETGANLRVVEAATKAAVGGLADITGVVDVTTKTLNAYNMSGDQATKVTDSISKAIEFGQVQWSDYTSQLGRVASIAAIVGVSLDEVNAFIAAATKNGATAEVAFTGLGATLAMILKPSKESAEAAEALGINWTLAGIRGEGFESLMSKLAIAMQQNPVLATEMVGGQEALRGAFAAASKGGKDYAMILEGLGGAAGKTDADFQTMKGSLENTLKALDTSFKNLSEALGTAFGPTVVIAVQDITKAVNGFADFMAMVPQPVMDTTGELVKLIAQMILLKKAIDAIIGLRLAFIGAMTGMAGATAASGAAATTSAGAFALYTNNTRALQAQAATATPVLNGMLGTLGRLAAIGAIAIVVNVAVTGMAALLQASAEIAKLRGQRNQPGGAAGDFGGSITPQQRKENEKTLDAIRRERQSPEFKGQQASAALGIGKTAYNLRVAQLQEREIAARARLALPNTPATPTTPTPTPTPTPTTATGAGTGAKKGSDDAKRAAEAAKQEAERVKDVIRNRLAEGQIIAVKSQQQDRIAAAEAAGDKMLVARLQSQERELDIQYRYAQELAKEVNLDAQKAIIYEGQNALTANQLDLQRELDAIQTQSDQDRLTSLQKAIEKQYELNTAVQNQLQLADGVANTLGQGLGSAFDALISGAQGWEDSLRQIASGVLVDIANQLIRIFVIEQAINAIKAFLTPFSAATPLGAGGGQVGKFGTLGPNFGIPQRAKGGPVSSGQTYMVGERGPELFVPGRSGTIVANDKMGGGSTNVIVNVDAKGSSVEGNEQGANQLGRVISAAVQSELIKQQRPGGILAR